MSNTDPPPELIKPKPQRRWYQYSIRSLLLLMVAVSLACGWFAVRWRRQTQQHIVKVTIAYPGASALTADEEVAWEYRFATLSAPYERLVTISTSEQVEVYFVAHGIDPDELLNRVRGVSVEKLPPGAVVQPATLLDRGASIPQVKSTLVDSVQIKVDHNKSSARGVSIAAIQKALSAQGKLVATKEGAERLRELAVASEGRSNHGTIRLGDIAEITIIQEPSAVVWQFPPASGNKDAVR